MVTSSLYVVGQVDSQLTAVGNLGEDHAAPSGEHDLAVRLRLCGDACCGQCQHARERRREQEPPAPSGRNVPASALPLNRSASAPADVYARGAYSTLANGQSDSSHSLTTCPKGNVQVCTALPHPRECARVLVAVA